MSGKQVGFTVASITAEHQQDTFSKIFSRGSYFEKLIDRFLSKVYFYHGIIWTGI